MISSQYIISQRERRTQDTPKVIADNFVPPEINVSVVGFCDGISDGIELGASDKIGVGLELELGKWEEEGANDGDNEGDTDGWVVSVGDEEGDGDGMVVCVGEIDGTSVGLLLTVGFICGTRKVG